MVTRVATVSATLGVIIRRYLIYILTDEIILTKSTSTHIK